MEKSYKKSTEGKIKIKTRTRTIGIWVLILLLFPPLNLFAEDSNKLVKISIQNEQALNELKDMGFEPLVIEEDHIVLRAKEAQKIQIEQAGFVILEFTEKDLVWRLIKTTISKETTPEARMSLACSGIDILQAQENFIIARAFDNQIKILENSGFVVEILFRDAKDYFKR